MIYNRYSNFSISLVKHHDNEKKVKPRNSKMLIVFLTSFNLHELSENKENKQKYPPTT